MQLICHPYSWLQPWQLGNILQLGLGTASARRDKPIVDYLFARLCPFIKRFQKSGYLPKKAAVIHRDLAFYQHILSLLLAPPSPLDVLNSSLVQWRIWFFGGQGRIPTTANDNMADAYVPDPDVPMLNEENADALEAAQALYDFQLGIDEDTDMDAVAVSAVPGDEDTHVPNFDDIPDMEDTDMTQSASSAVPNVQEDAEAGVVLPGAFPAQRTPIEAAFVPSDTEDARAIGPPSVIQNAPPRVVQDTPPSQEPSALRKSRRALRKEGLSSPPLNPHSAHDQKVAAQAEAKAQRLKVRQKEQELQKKNEELEKLRLEMTLHQQQMVEQYNEMQAERRQIKEQFTSLIDDSNERLHRNIADKEQELKAETDRRMAELEAEAEQRKAELEVEAEQRKAELEADAEKRKEELEVEAEAQKLALDERAAKNKADLETRMAVFAARQTIYGPPRPTVDRHFPTHPPELMPKVVSDSVRKQRNLQVIADAAGHRLPNFIIQADAAEPMVIDPDTAGPNGNIAEPNGATSSGEPNAVASSGEPNAAASSGSTSATSQMNPSQSLPIDWNDPRLEEKLAPIVQKLFQQHGIKDMTVTRTVRRKKENKYTTTKKNAKAQLMKTENERWQALAREFLVATTGCNQAKDYRDYEPATDDQKEQCDEGDLIPQADSKLYFGSGFLNCTWNTKLLLQWSATLQARQNADHHHWGVPKVEGKRLDQAAWKKRKTTKYTSRKAIIEKMIHIEIEIERKQVFFDTSGSNVSQNTNVATWRFLEQLLEHLQNDGMSSEEVSDQEVVVGVVRVLVPVHKVLISPWRNEKIRQYMEWVDEGGAHLKLKSAAQRTRVRVPEKSDTKGAPHKLPHSLYSEDWLAGEKIFDDDIETTLEISTEEFKVLEKAEQATPDQAQDELLPQPGD
ncbi:hypothetical protein K438DRAFT_1947503 [Mycena galopus ATCC 62051]|nr:hypothetical protein K438DRAFT_1947503 [Mycena galopus ATCC 62051]